MGKGWYDWLEYKTTFNAMKLYSAFNNLINKRLLYPWNSWTILLLS